MKITDNRHINIGKLMNSITCEQIITSANYSYINKEILLTSN